MTPEQYQQVKQIFSAVLELPGAQRAAFLAEHCAGDAELRAEVESLLQSHEAAERFIETPALAMNATLLAGIPTLSDADGQPEPSALGKRIGAYEIVRELGEGGMGVVYLAVRADDQYRQHVAIKLIRQGFASDFLVRRFRHERQILASLNHPNIARLFDGGTTEDGRPYLVMEYIEGEPIDAYCDAHQLPLANRLQLFLQVCAAVQFAHQNLIVHRDLKPGNILVTVDGTPKLLDFGIAKLLQDEAHSAAITQPDATLTGMRLMTPGYASPEQVRDEAITTASDVYSLGCILYELLTGHRPYHVSSLSPQQIIQVICESQPTRPSAMVLRTENITGRGGTVGWIITPEQVSKARTDQPEKLRQKLFGDLDNIVLFALRKEPSLRYASARELAEDLMRHLSGNPVLARPQTLTYRASRFFQRNSLAVVAALLLALTLLGGLGATLWQARVAQRERAKAEQRFNDVRQLAHAVVFEMHDAIQNLPGSTPARALLVKRALEYLDNLSREAGQDRSLQQEMAAAYEKIAQVQGDPYRANLGETDGAVQSYQKALSLREALAQANPNDATARLELAECLDRLGWIIGSREGPKKGLELHQRSQALLAALPDEPKVRAALARNLESIGQIHFAEGEYDQALERYRQSTDLVTALSQQSAVPDDQFKYRRALAIGKLNVAAVYSAQRQWPQAIETAREGIKLAEALATENPANALAQRDLTSHLNHLGDVLWYSGDTKTALDYYQQSLKLRRKLAAEDPQNAQLKRDVALCLSNAGYVLAEQGDARSAQSYYQEAFAIFETLLAANPDSAKEQQDLMRQQAFYGDVNKILAGQPQASQSQRVTYWQTARASYQRSLEMWLTLVRKGVAQGNDAGQEKKLRDEIEKCEQALTQLR